MFKKGDVIQRKPKYYDKYWVECFCDRGDFPLNEVFTVVKHRPEEETVRFITREGKEWGVYDYKMELAVLTLENE